MDTDESKSRASNYIGALLIAVVLMLAGCGSDSDGNSGGDTPAEWNKFNWNDGSTWQ